jgi:hypothetical protein
MNSNITTELSNEADKPAFLVGAVSGSILINKEKKFERQRHISSNSNFFKGELIIKIELDKITFRKPTIDYEGKRYKISSHKNGTYHCSVVCELPLGKFEFDTDESNEDCVVVYCR